MSDVSLNDIRAALKDILQPVEIPDIRVKDGRVTVTVAKNIPTAQKPGFAAEVKRRAATVAGVTEVYVTYQESAQGAAPQQPAPGPKPLQGVARVLAVGSGKGGVGKSTVSVNLAVSFAQQGLKVGLLDADVYGPSVALMTGTDGHAAQASPDQRILPARAHGIDVISVAFLLPKDRSAVIWRGPLVGRMVTQLLGGVVWGELDVLVVDLPPGTGDAVLSLSQAVPLSGAVVVTTPQDVALIDVQKAVEMFQQVKVPVAGVVENMAGFVCPKCGEQTDIFLSGAGQKAARQFDIPLLGSLPLDPSVPPSGDKGSPIVVADPEGAPAQAIRNVAQKTLARLDALEAASQAAQVNMTWEG